MNTFFLISLIALCSALIAVVIIVLYHHSFSHVTFIFTVMFVQLFLWTVIHIISQFLHDGEMLIYFARLSLAVLVFFPTTFVHFSYFFYNPSLIIPRNLFLLYSVPLLLFPFTLSPLTASYLVSMPISLNSVNIGPFYLIFDFYFLIYSLFGLFNLLRCYFRPGNKPRLQLQLRYIIIGFSFSLVVGLMTKVILPEFFGLYVTTDYGPLASYAVALTTLYAIVRLRFFHITIAMQKNMLIVFVVCLWTVVYTGISVLLFSLLYQVSYGQGFLFIYIFISLAFHFIVTYFLIIQLQRFLQTLYFQERVHFSKFFTDAPGNTTLNSTHEITSFSLKFAGMIQEKTEAPVNFFYILQEPYGRYVDFFKTKNKILYLNNNIIKELAHNSDVYTFNEVDSNLEKKELARFLKKHNVDLMISIKNPQKFKDPNPIAFIGVGRHKNNRNFSVSIHKSLIEDIEYAEHSIPILLRWQYTVEDLIGRMRDGRLRKPFK